MLILIAFGVLLAVGLGCERLDGREAWAFVAIWAGFVVVFAVLHITFVWTLVPTLFLNFVLVFKVIGHDVRFPSELPTRWRFPFK